jgi:hypothetical protein
MKPEASTGRRRKIIIIMPIIQKTTALYEHTEALIAALKLKDFAGKSEGNLTAAMVASVVTKTFISELMNTASPNPGKDGTEQNPHSNPAAVEWLESLLEESAKAERSRIRAVIQPCITAAKNYQDSYCQPSGLLHKSKLEGGAAQAEFD